MTGAAYCVNCGAAIEVHMRVCRACCGDPRVPGTLWREQISKAPGTHEIPESYPAFAFPGERVSLVLAIVVSSALLFIFTTMTFGLILVLLVLAIAIHRISWVQTRAAMVKVSEDSHPTVLRLAEIAAGRLRMSVPPVFIKQDPHPNAYATGLFGHQWIVIHSSLLELLGPAELLGVIGHEMGHVGLGHTTWLLLSNPARGANVPVLSMLLRPIFNNWHLRSEYSADRAGVIALGEIRTSILIDLKLAGGKQVDQALDLDGYLRSIERASDDLPTTAIGFFRTHPFLENRIRRKLEFYRGPVFKGIWERYAMPDAMSASPNAAGGA